MSHIMKHLLENKICRSLCDESCFQVIDYASFPFRLKVKEALHINWLKSSLNKQKEHVNITISVLLGHFVSSLSSSSSSSLLLLLIVFIWLIHCTWVFVQIQHSHNTHTRTRNIKITILFNSGRPVTIPARSFDNFFSGPESNFHIWCWYSKYKFIYFSFCRYILQV